MALLSGMMRSAAFTGSTDSVFTRIAGRQGRQWAERTVAAAYPAGRPVAGSSPAPNPTSSGAEAADTVRELEELRERGVVSDGEFERLRGSLRSG